VDGWTKLHTLLTVGYEGIKDYYREQEDFFYSLVINTEVGISYLIAIFQDGDSIELEDLKGHSAAVYCNVHNPEHLRKFVKDLPNLTGGFVEQTNELTVAMDYVESLNATPELVMLIKDLKVRGLAFTMM
jgi:hypothetical protein